jgi:hypothetical protein
MVTDTVEGKRAKVKGTLVKNEMILSAGKWMGLETIRLSKKSQTQKDINICVLLICRI